MNGSRPGSADAPPKARVAATIAIVAAAALAAVGVVKGTWAVGGSDSSCYGLMAEAFAEGRLQPVSSLALDAPWPDAFRATAPAGFIPSPVRPGAASPICAPGFSLLMAPLAAVAGRDAIFWFTPIAAAALVWFAFVFGRRLGGGMAGGVAAVLTATSPIVLFQTVQPMNDITCAALWMAALVAATSESQSRHWWAGLLAGAAILVRPNLAPLALIVLAAGSWRPEPMLQFGVGMMPGVAAVLGLNVILYGSPLSSGYGDPAQLFSTRYLTDNVRNYASALYDTQNLLPLLALATPFVLIGHARRLSLLALGAIAMVFVIYAIYQPFPEWWYLRFLLPAVVLLLVLAAVTSARVARRARMGGVIAIATVIIALAGVRIARDRQAFDLQRMEGRYRAMANLISSRLPDRAVLITVWESGSVRFHAGREVVLWDAVDPDWLDRAVSWLNERERPTYILVERREENEFRTRFRNRSALGALDWPPRFDLNRQARVFDTADRARHLAGERYATENVR